MRRIADDAALAAAERDVRDGALPRHPRGQRRDLVERDAGVIADAALGRTERDVVLHAVAGEDLDLAVVHLHRARDDDLALGVGEDLPDAGLEVEDARRLVELLRASRAKIGPWSAIVQPNIAWRRAMTTARVRHGARMGAGDARWPGARRGDSPSARRFTTISGRPIERLYTPSDLAGLDYARDLGDPGAFPYTRGIHPTGYRGKLWTMRQFAGFGTPEETNARYKALLAAGGTGLSVAFDLPTLMGRDPDHELSLGEVGKCGVNVTSLADMETLFDGISLGDITTSMTINSPAAMIFAMYLVVAEQQGADWKTLSGTIQNDILKEFIAQKEYIFPPRPSMRLITDIFAFCATRGAAVEHDLGQRLPHPRGRRDGAAGTGVHAARRHRVRAVGRRRRASTSTRSCRGCRSSSTRTATSSRRSPSTARRGSSGPRRCAIASARQNERSWKLRFHTQTAGVSLTAQQPYNNVVRTALQALSAVLGGTNSLHTNSLDEALALPTAEAATLALRTQQIIAHESGVANVVDPLGGFVFRREADAATWRRARWPTSTRSTAWAAWSRPSSAASRSRRSPRAPTGSSRRSSARRSSSSASTTSSQQDEPPFEILYIDESAADTQLAQARGASQRPGNATRVHAGARRPARAPRARRRT